MLKPYRTVQDVLSSPWAQVQRVKRSPQQTDRVLRSTKLEDSIYRDLRMEDTGMDEIENSAGEKLHSFPALSRDIFQSFYSLMPRRNADDDLSVAARKINMPILEHITQSEDYCGRSGRVGKSCCPDAAGDRAERGTKIRSCSFLRPRPLSNGCISSRAVFS